MALIASIDGPTRRIYLDSDSTLGDVHPMDIYKEMRTLRRLDEGLRKFDPFMSGLGNILKRPGRYTERYVRLNSVDVTECLIVPYDASHRLSIIGTLITDTGKEGRDCFDRSGLTPGVEVDIDYQPPQVEVIEVGTSGLTGPESTALLTIAADQALIQSDIADITSDISSINVSISTINSNITTITADLARALGLMKENCFLDQTTWTVYNGVKLMTGGRLRVYSVAGSVGTANDVIATYSIVSNFNQDGELVDYRVVRVA